MPSQVPRTSTSASGVRCGTIREDWRGHGGRVASVDHNYHHSQIWRPDGHMHGRWRWRGRDRVRNHQGCRDQRAQDKPARQAGMSRTRADRRGVARRLRTGTSTTAAGVNDRGKDDTDPAGIAPVRPSARTAMYTRTRMRAGRADW